MRRRISVLVMALLMALMMAAGPASAQQGGCKTFGQILAAEGQAGQLRENVRNIAPANDEVHFFQGALCS